MDSLRDRYLSEPDEDGEQFDAGTGEVMPADVVIEATVKSEETQRVFQSPMIAANGDRLPQIAATAGNFIDMLEDGQFSADVNTQLQEMAAAMEDIAQFNGGKSKGKLVITIDLTKEDSVFKIASAFKATKPELPRPKSVLWTTDRNEFSRFPPGQNQLFGLRPATKAGQG